MALSKALVQPFRKANLLIGSGWRAFFAPFNFGAASASALSTNGPNILDLAIAGPFNTNAPPAGWFDLGWLKDVKVTPASKIGKVRAGYRGAVRAQFRGEVGEQMEFKFREMSRMSYKIATGSEVFNLLATNTGPSTVGPLSSSGTQAVPLMASGYQAGGAGTVAGSPALFVPAGSGALFAAGQYVVADIDYNTSLFGLVGDAGIPVFQGAVVDVDFIRKTSDYVARIKQVVPTAVTGGDALVLTQPMVGGGSAPLGTTPNTGPVATSKVQRIEGFSAREGGTYITEWSGLFILDTIDGAQIAFYYPHLSINQFKDVNGWTLENAGTTDLTGYELDCMMEALAFDDPLDGETVVCYRAFYMNARQQDIAI